MSCAASLSTPLSLSLLLHRWPVWLLHLLHPAVRSVFCGGRAPLPPPRSGGDSCKRVSDVVVVVVVTLRRGGGGCRVRQRQHLHVESVAYTSSAAHRKTHTSFKTCCSEMSSCFFKHSLMKKAATCPSWIQSTFRCFFPRMEPLFFFFFVFDPYH